MATIADLVTYVRPYVKNCVDDTIEREAIRVLQKFCQDSWFYQKDMDPVDSVIGVRSYAIPVTGTDVVTGVVQVHYDTILLHPYRKIDYIEDDLVEGTPLTWRYDPPDTLVLNSIPDDSITDAIQMRIALSVTDATTTIPDMIQRFHMRTLEAGILANLYRMPGEVWTDFQLATEFYRSYLAGINDAKRVVQRGFISGTLQMKAQRFTN